MKIRKQPHLAHKFRLKRTGKPPFDALVVKGCVLEKRTLTMSVNIFCNNRTGHLYAQHTGLRGFSARGTQWC